MIGVAEIALLNKDGMSMLDWPIIMSVSYSLNVSIFYEGLRASLREMFCSLDSSNIIIT